MERNKELFDKIADQIEQYPESHHQGTWGSRCGTKCCVAGWAARLSGARPAEDPQDGVAWWFCYPPGDDTKATMTPIYAARVLGLTEDEADIMFASDWDPLEIYGLSVPEALREIGCGALDIEPMPEV